MRSEIISYNTPNTAYIYYQTLYSKSITKSSTSLLREERAHNYKLPSTSIILAPATPDCTTLYHQTETTCLLNNNIIIIVKLPATAASSYTTKHTNKYRQQPQIQRVALGPLS